MDGQRISRSMLNNFTDLIAECVVESTVVVVVPSSSQGWYGTMIGRDEN